MRPSPRRPGERLVAVTLALVLNAGLLVALGSGRSPRPPEPAHRVALAASPILALSRLPDLAPESQGGPTPGGSPRDDALERMLATLPMGHPTDRLVRVRNGQPELAAATTVPIAASSRVPIDLGTLDTATGPPVRARFMGVEASGHRFCIIADRSGSMQRGGKIEYLTAEILKTVGGLRGSARFYIILFNQSAESIPSDHWLGGKPQDVVMTERWLTTIHATGETDPVPAFQMAFKMKPRPDAIFFMTDGIFSPAAGPIVNSLNNGRRKVPIHAISFLDQGAEAILRRMASQSGGSYRHVSGF